jgi:segregation and condensation protein A
MIFKAEQPRLAAEDTNKYYSPDILAMGEQGDDFDSGETFSYEEGSPGPKAGRNDSEPQIRESADGVDVAKMKGEDLKLEKIVALPTWREILLELVASKKLDPWNIDIVDITAGYVERLKGMELSDLRVPANLILAAAILLRFKSDALRFEEETQVVEEQTYVEEDTEPTVIPVLELRTRIPPKRMVSLDELLVAMEKVFEEQKKREERLAAIPIPQVINIQLPEFNIEERMEKVYQNVVRTVDSTGLSTFSGILPGKTPLDMITTLLPLLHLVQDRRLSIFQEKFLGEIFIRVRDKNATEAVEPDEEFSENGVSDGKAEMPKSPKAPPAAKK